MHIREIVLEGFKSYATRTTVGPFDEHFNAITGLNGSGKSNILDSICFVMGITSLSQVRAQALSDFIYKQGTAGVTRASVSIMFDNRNKEQAPDGYKMFDELTVTRIVESNKSKYLLNGKNATQSAIHDLFKSVSLNVNNPRFLILQGQVTKVSKSKPQEILGLIEEAAGTRMYDQKKAEALKTIAKKDDKLKEIRTTIDTDITPTINKLQQDEQNYKMYTELKKRYKLLNDQLIAYEYWQLITSVKQTEIDVENMEIQTNEYQERNEVITEEIKQIHSEVKIIEKERNENVGNEVSELQTVYDKQLVELRNLTNDNDRLSKQLSQYKQQLTDSEQQHKQLTNSIEQLEKDIESSRIGLVELDKKVLTDTEHVKQLQRRHEAVSTGTAVVGSSSQAANGPNDDSRLTNKEKLDKYKEQRGEIAIQIKQLQQRIDHSTGELKKLRLEQKSLTSKQGTYSSMRTEFDKKKTILNQCEKDLAKLQFDVEHLKQCHFQYTNPTPNFDRAKHVHGLVATLFNINDTKYAQALELTAGGKLFNVVVDTDETSKLLFKYGDLKKRITFVPLNRITSHLIPKNKIESARRELGDPNSIFLAKDLVRYDHSKYETLMNYVFGSTIICSTSAIAQRVAFDEKLGLNAMAITLDGDIYNPAGILSGGDRSGTNRGPTLLETVAEMNQLEENIRQNNSNNRQELNKLERDYVQYQNLQQQVDSLTNEIQLLELKLAQNDEHRLQTEITTLEQQELNNKKELDEQRHEEKILNDKINELEKLFKNEGEAKKKELAEIEQLMKKAEKQVDLSQKRSREMQTQIKDLEMQLESQRAELDTLTSDMDTLRNTIETSTQSLNDANKTLSNKQIEIDELHSSLQTKRSRLTEYNNRIHSLHQKEQQLIKERRENELQLEKNKHSIVDLQNIVKDSVRRRQLIIEKHGRWIEEEKDKFGVSGGQYDFASMNISKMQKDAKDDKEKVTKMSKHVDERAMTLLEQKRAMYKQLLTKQKKVLKDKANIERVVAEWDKKKQEALRIAWQRVNKSFGEIFSTLLHNANAKLTSLNGHYDADRAPKDLVLTGLEIKVQFGSLWKETLDELSGGQRSLAGLSLVLALLQYSPAPLYILDEVDAALDMSHTQNIGLVIRKSFRNAQFIIVSLKDGMFSNANVLFTTKFVNGISTVSRAENVPNKKSKDKDK
ncbi:unnamed protein product [Rotaria sp. Silwood2]|nr:unnamed protein product [Rotaria sp. Silwood2]